MISASGIISDNILTILFLQPLLFAVLGVLLSKYGKAKDQIIWYSAILCTLLSALEVIYIMCRFDYTASSYQFYIRHEWIETLGIRYIVGIDGISLGFIALTALLIPLCLIISMRTIKGKVLEFTTLFLLLEALIFGVFSALDAFLFYLFFEAVLIPMFLIIGLYGGERRIYAAFKFFLYTFLGSVLMLLALVYIILTYKTASIEELAQLLPTLPLVTQNILFLAFFSSFAIKIPMWPLHTWLPDAHVEAPTAGSVILAGVLLKLGGYGFLRFSLPMLPQASQYFSSLIVIMSLIAIIYTSMVALMQTDMKKLIAYSSIAHMGFVTAGIFSFNYDAVMGSTLQMISHGLVSAALFICVGVLYERAKTKKISDFGGVTAKMPRFALCFMIFSLASIGLPATSGFIGEFTVLAGLLRYNSTYAFFAALGMILSAAYMLYLYKNVMFGTVNNDRVRALIDLNYSEKFALYILVGLVLVLGIYPTLMTTTLHPKVNEVTQVYTTQNISPTLATALPYQKVVLKEEGKVLGGAK